ncbi:MAG: DNA-binding response OmpR family regulator [Colwellia sp.]|jgi:DNA-binding response OmpR family regulator
MNTNEKHIIIIEDDKRLNQMIAGMLKEENYRTTSIYDGLTAISAINSEHPDIVLLDMMLPGCDGLEVLRKIDKLFLGVIIMITAKSDCFLEVSALNLGVHDFITKPIRPHVLLAKISALSRLNQNKIIVDQNIIIVQNLRVDANKRELRLDNKLVDITSGEYEIIIYFMRNPSTILNRDKIIKDIRNIEYDGEDRSIDMRISSLRKKLNDTQPPYKYIKTIRTQGYILTV